MEPSTTMIMITAAGMLAALIGLLVFVVGLIILIVRAIMKKTVKAALIVMIVGIVLIVGGLFTFKTSYSKISDDYKDSLIASRLENAEKDENGNNIYRIGSFSVTDGSGSTIDNSTLAAYKYTIINMWEPWCGPCKMELPDLEKLYEDYRDKGVNMIGVYNTEEDADTVITENGLTYPTVYLDDDAYTAVFGMFQTGSVPVTFVLDSEGRLVELDLTEEELTANAGGSLSEEMRGFYNGVISGRRTYEFWSEKLDALLGQLNPAER